MFKRLQLVVALAVLTVLMGSWGFLVHRTVHQLAVYQLPKKMRSFFYQNMENLVSNAPRPDTRRNQDSTEATKHFIDAEAYGADAIHTMPMEWEKAVQLYTKDSLLKYGYVPYHILYMKNKLTEAFRSRNKDSILFYAADLGHYIGDANVPLHTTLNYDGQLTNQRGLHSLWESTIPELELNGFNLHSTHKAKYLKHPDLAIWTAVRRAAALVPGILEKEKEVSQSFTEAQKYRTRTSRGREFKTYSTEFAKAYAAVLQPTVNEQLIHSANLIADFWYTSWMDAGKPDLAQLAAAWTPETGKKYKAEFKSYKDNTLIRDKLLLSRKTESRDSD
jgi:hypothetical protein